MADFAIVGAGLSGLTVAQRLKKAGHYVVLFEKNEHSGGRLSTYYNENWQADIGTQYFTAKSPEFIQQLESWQAQHLVQPWSAVPAVFNGEQLLTVDDPTIRYVGTPAMSSLVKPLVSGLDIYTQTRIDRLDYFDNRWRLWDSTGEHFGLFDSVILTAPLAQTMALLPTEHSLGASLRSIVMRPCWSMAITFAERLNIEPDAVFCENNIVSWIARDSSKPERDSSRETWVVHFSPNWTGNHLKANERLVLNQALSFLGQLTSSPLPDTADSYAYCWLYATSSRVPESVSLWDPRLRIGIAGDWTIGTRLEDAWLSADHLIKSIEADPSIS